MEPNMDYFFIPYKTDFILYVPLTKKVLYVEKSLKKALEGTVKTKKGNELIIEFLKGNGIDLTEFKTGKKSHELKPLKKYQPVNMAIFPTSACNSNCIYCFADSNFSKADLEWPPTKKAIDTLITNCLETKRKKIEIIVMGGGEPTMRLDFLKKLVNYTQENVKANQLKCRFKLITNGIFPKKEAKWLGENFYFIQFSIDGTRETHSRLRPLKNGQNSFDIIVSNIHALEETKLKKLGIKITITKDTVHQLSDFIEFVHSNFKTKLVFFSMLKLTGRGKGFDALLPENKDFLRELKKAIKKATQLGFDTDFPFHFNKHPDMTNCLLSQALVLTETGKIVTCPAYSPKDPDQKIFEIGRFEARENDFVIDDKKRAYLAKKEDLAYLPQCADCFAKYDCKGECALENCVTTGSIFKIPKNYYRCELAREMVKFQLTEIIEDKVKYAPGGNWIYFC